MIDVVAGVIVKNGNILLAQRNCVQHDGKWEFPGGKIESGETPQESLARELCEEFGVDCAIGTFVGENIHDYGNKKIRLMAYFVEHISGEFECRDHAAITWVKPNRLITYDLAEADIPLVSDILRKL